MMKTDEEIMKHAEMMKMLKLMKNDELSMKVIKTHEVMESDGNT